VTQHYPFFTCSRADAHAQRLPARLRSNALVSGVHFDEFGESDDYVLRLEDL